MAIEKGLNPETGLPVKVDLKTSRLLDPETDKPVKLELETHKLVNRVLRDMSGRLS
jgi:hypothetical protein